MSLEDGVLGADWLWLDVTGTHLKFSGDEGADRNQYDRVPTMGTVARHADHRPVPHSELPETALFK